MSKTIRNGNVFCLESLWDNNMQYPKQSVLPILREVCQQNGVGLSHLNCNTKEEFVFNLEKFNRKFGIVYLAFHGEPNEILLHNGESINLEELAKLMGHRFKRCGIHFASCKVLGADEKFLIKFLKKTEVSFISGYEKSVYWIPSLAIDMVYLDYLMDNIKNPALAIEGMKTQIVPDERNVGFRFVS